MVWSSLPTLECWWERARPLRLRNSPTGKSERVQLDPSPLRGVLFDVDGTLVDTTYLHAVSWWSALGQYDALSRRGHEVTMARIHRGIGMGSDQLLDYLLGEERDREQDGPLAGTHQALYAQYWPQLRPLPGARELVRACASHGLSVVLVSSANPRELSVLRGVLQCDDVIATATSAEDVERSKPAPDIVQAALDEVALAPADVVMVGDSVWDVVAAAKLAIACIGLTCGGISRQELQEAGASAVYADPADLHAHLAEAMARGGRQLT